MKIHDYYREIANVQLNGSIVALIPPVIIVCGDIFIFQNKQILLLVIPFLIYSLVCFQFYLYRMKQSISIENNMSTVSHYYQSIFGSTKLIVTFMNTQSAKVILFFPNGQMAGVIKKHKAKGLKDFFKPKTYALYNAENIPIGFYLLKGEKIEVFDEDRQYLGCFKQKKITWLKSKKEMFDAVGSCIGAVEGASYYMDEQIYNPTHHQVARLRRGWMPLEWSSIFPEPNTPVFSFSRELSEEDKLLRMSTLIHEFFIER